jgi:hypothetical protein
MTKLSQTLEKLANDFDNMDNELLVLADEENDETVLSVVSEAMAAVSNILKTAGVFVKKNIDKNAAINKNDLEELVAIADEFDNSDDPALVRQAGVIDQLLMRYAEPTGLESPDEAKTNRMSEKNRAERSEELYHGIKEDLHKQIESEKAIKAIRKQVKEYRPLEAPLSTRVCPDHPGTMVSRVSDNVVQCPIDGKTYDYREGFTTAKGNKVPGGSVSEQTAGLVDSVRQQTTFSTREGKIGERAE